MLKQILAASALALTTLTACGTSGPTPYQPQTADSSRGYSETRIENDRWRISFKGNSMTGRETVENYMLYRAAELTIQNGYDTFTVVNRDTDKQSRTREYGGMYAGTYLSYMYFVPRYGWVGAYEPYWTPSRYEQVTRYEAYAEILMGKGAKGSDPATFDARQVSQNLAGVVQRAPQQ
jgi:predicted small lipoprotein YifL